MPSLTTHLIGRLTGKTYTSDEAAPTTDERLGLRVVDDTVYMHKVLRINYTTYDMRRDQDSVNPRNHADVMVLAPEDERDEGGHPYWYARVIGVFHANVRYNGPGSTAATQQSRRVEFLWVRWFEHDTKAPGGFKKRRYPRIGFINTEQEPDAAAFGFLDPACVIRAVHLIPAYVLGRTAVFLGGQKSIARQYTKDVEDIEDDEDEDDEDEDDSDEDDKDPETTDWVRFYVDM